MNSPEEWDRFMRFMERYAESNGLGFTKAGWRRFWGVWLLCSPGEVSVWAW
jgi:hypothetical protein